MFRVIKNEFSQIDHKSVASRGLKVSAVLAGVLLAGCESYQRDHFTVGSVPTDYRTTHPIVVSQSEVTADLVVTRTMRGMSFRQENIVTEFTDRFNRSGAQSVRIVLPSGSHNQAAAKRVGSDIVKHMHELGVNPSRIKVVRYHASNHGDAASLRLSYDSITSKVHSECGQWNEDLIETSENRNYGNFGCATQSNLAEIIANPEDLLSPRGQSETDAARRDNVINDWRENGTAGLPSLL